MLVYVKSARYIQGYEIEVEFTDGTKKIVDLKEHLNGDIFKPLTDVEFFKTFEVNKDTETIEWSNGADFAPSFLYDL